MRRFPLDRLILLSSMVACGALVMAALWVGLASSRWEPPAPKWGEYAVRTLPSVRWPDVDAGDAGRIAGLLGAGEETRPLPPEDLSVPDLDAYTPALPLFDPSPDLARFPGGFPSLPDATVKPEDLPATADLQALADLGKPPPPPEAGADVPAAAKPEEVFDSVVVIKSGKKIFGKIEGQDAGKLLFRNKDDGILLTLKTGEYSQLNRAATPERAYEEKSKALAGSKDAAEFVKLADWCVEQKLFAQAGEAMATAVRLNPKDLRWISRLADMRIQAGDYEAALAACEGAGSTSGIGRETVDLRRGQILEGFGLWGQALDAYRGAVQAMPNLTEGHLGLARAACASGDHEEALKSLAKARSLGAAAADTQLIEGHCALEHGDLTGALAAADAVLTARADDAEAMLLKGSCLAMGAVPSVALPAGSNPIKEAASLWAKAAKARPADARPMVNLGALLLRAGKASDAEICFSGAVDRNPASTAARCGLVMARRAVARSAAPKDDDEKPGAPPANPPDKPVADARTALDEAIRADPNAWPLLLADALLQLDDAAGPAGAAESANAPARAAARTAARDRLKTVLRLVPDYTPAWTLLGHVEFVEHRYREALWFFEQAAARSPQDLRLLLGRTLSALGCEDASAARPLVTEALTADPARTLVLEAAGYLDYLDGKNTESMARFKSVLEHSADDAYAKEAVRVIGLNVGRTLWEETFERADRPVVGRRWVESERYGLEAKIAGGKLHLVGTQKGADHGMTVVERETDGNLFLRLGAEVDVTDAGAATVGLRVGSRPGAGSPLGGIVLVRTAQGKIAWATVPDFDKIKDPASMPTDYKELCAAPPSPTLSLAIDRVITDQQGNEIVFLVNGLPVGLVPATVLSLQPMYLVGVFGEAPVNTVFDLAVMRIRLVQKKQDRK